MALPLIPALAALAAAGSAAFAAKKGYDTYQDTKEAKYWHEIAKEEYESSERTYKRCKGMAEEVFAEFGRLKKSVIEETFPRYFRLLDKLNLSKQNDLGEVFQGLDLKALQESRQKITDLEATLGGIVGGGVAGAMAGFGAYGAVGLLASASTGTAIGTLSGVAATNATLAWLGGGSLAAGGLGVAGGTAVLGSIVAAPVIAVATLVWAKCAESNKYDAMSYHSAVKAICECIDAEKMLWVQIDNRADESKVALSKIDKSFGEAMYLVENIYKSKGDDVAKWSKDEQESVKDMIQLAEATQTIINAPILFDDDPITKDIIKHQKKTKELMDELQAQFGEK